MGQRLAFVAAAGLIAFVVVLLGALGAYVAVAGTSDPAAASGAPAATTITTPATPPGAGDATPAAPAGTLTPTQAAASALRYAPGATVIGEPQLGNLRGTLAYAVQLNIGIVYVDAQSGQVLATRRARP